MQYFWLGAGLVFGTVLVSTCTYGEIKKCGLDRGLANMLTGILLVTIFLLVMFICSRNIMLAALIFAIICWRFPYDKISSMIVGFIKGSERVVGKGEPGPAIQDNPNLGE